MSDVSIDDIVNELHPDKIRERITEPHQKIRNSYTLEETTIEDWEEFKKAVSGYIQHHNKEFHKTDEKLSEHDAYGMAAARLDAIFQRDGGMAHAFRLAKQGRMADVVNALADSFENEALANYTRHQRDRIAPEDMEAHTKLVEGIMGKLKPMLPEGTEFEKPEFYASDSARLIELYRGMIRDIRQYTREREERGG